MTASSHAPHLPVCSTSLQLGRSGAGWHPQTSGWEMPARSCPSLSPTPRGPPWAALIFRGTGALQGDFGQPPASLGGPGPSICRSLAARVAVTRCPWSLIAGAGVQVPKGGQVPASSAVPGCTPRITSHPGKTTLLEGNSREMGIFLQYLFFLKPVLLPSTELNVQPSSALSGGWEALREVAVAGVPQPSPGPEPSPDLPAAFGLDQPSTPKLSQPRTLASLPRR